MKKIALIFLLLVVTTTLSLSTTRTIISNGFVFSPDTVTITLGDTIQFTLASFHNVLQVDKAVWDTNGTIWNGGFKLPFGGGKLVIASPGTYYYVCQVHGGMGMKGTITVGSPPPPNTITVRSFIDQDGNAGTGGDQFSKPWNLKLYQDSIASGIVVGSVSSDDSLVVGNLSAGTYVAVEADSLYWSHISQTVDGVSQGAVASNQRVITIGSGEVRRVDFINYAPNTIVNSGTTFVPDSLVVISGDRIQFVLESIHDAREVSEATWNSNGTTSNGGFEVPFGGGSVVIADTGVHYYVCIAHAFMGMKGKIVVLPDSAKITNSSKIIAGWNLLSIPSKVSDNSLSALFPMAISRAFEFLGSYLPQETMSPGYGYWLKFNDSQSVSINGIIIKYQSDSVQKGWNMVGSISTPIPTGAMKTEPSGIINSPFYGYNGSYVISDTIHPGFGYWMNVSQSGILIYDATAVPVPKQTANQIFKNTGTLTITDAAGNKKTLYLAESSEANAGLKFFAELPPVPPMGAFDVRFKTGQQVKFISDKKQEEFPVLISSPVFPLTISWDMSKLSRAMNLTIDQNEMNLRQAGRLVVDKTINSISVNTTPNQAQPTQYVLRQAFPNPFNPSTIIQYSLPEESRVSLTVFNILGEVVARLVDGVEPAGEKFVTFDAGNRPSGIYFVRLQAANILDGAKSFSQVIKIILQK